MRSSPRVAGGDYFTSIHLDPREDVVIVRRLSHVQGPGDTPGQRLLVQRDVADIVEERNLVGAGEIVVPFGGVRLEKCSACEFVYLRIAIAPHIVAAPVGLRVSAAYDVLKDVGALEGRWRPSQKVERAVVPARSRYGREEFSLNGFFPLILEWPSSSRVWSIPRKIVRTSGPARTCDRGLALTRSWSLSGTGSVQSISPESSAATRVAELGIGVNTTSSTFPIGLSHQFGFFFQTVFTPDSWLTKMKGPVPFAWSPA